MGFKQSTSDPCVYMSSGGDAFYIAVYVDDMILAGPTEQKIKEVKRALSKRVEIKDLGKLHYFLSIAVKQGEEQGHAWIGQPRYTRNLLKRFEMQGCKPVTMPVDTSVKLQKTTDEDELVDQQLFQSVMGRLMYLSVYKARHCLCDQELSEVLCKAHQSSLDSTETCVAVFERDHKSWHSIPVTRESEFVGFADADWAGDVIDRRSTSGYMFCLSGGAIS